MSKPIAVSDQEFDAKVLKSDVPVVVDFWAPWCGPCRAIAPILEELATEYEGRLTVAKVNVDEDGEYAGKFGIQGIPTLLVFKDGQEVDRLVGARPKNMFREKFEQVLGE